MARSMTRQKEYELQAADARRRWEEMRQQVRAREEYYNAHSVNTLGPQEDVVESRRLKRSRVVVEESHSTSTRSILAENMLLLVLLVASIYGLYCLSIYLLNQS